MANPAILLWLDGGMGTGARTEIWAAVREERRALVRDLQTLTPTQWTTASLCAGWDVHDVVAHLVDTAKTTRRGFLRRMIATGFDFDRDNAHGIANEKSPDPTVTLAKLRAVADRTSAPPANLATRLVEMFVHGEDIRRPLGITREYPPSHVATALKYQVKTSTKIGGGKETAKGWRLVATDTAFECGSGADILAPVIVLLLAVSGRPVALSELGSAGAGAGAGAKAFLASTKSGHAT